MSYAGTFQYFPLRMPQTVGAATPNIAAIVELGIVPPSSRIRATWSGESFLRRPACSQGDEATRRTGSDAQESAFPVAQRTTVLNGTPVFAEISELFRSPSSKSLRASAYISGVVLPVLLFTLSRLKWPAFAEYLTFSAAVFHSRFSGRLSSLTKFLWFTCISPTGSGRKARATNLWTPTRLGRLPPSASCRLTYLYPRLSSEPVRTLSDNTRVCSWSRTRPGSVLTLPKLLTSYRPSYPGTGFQISCSISNSFRWLCGLTRARATDASRTPVSLDGQAQKQTRPSPQLTFSAAR